jgi:hypothetical protein
MGDVTITPFLGPNDPVGDSHGIPPILGVLASARWQLSWAYTCSPHIKVVNAFDTICTDLLPMTQYCSFWALLNQT